jgi:hypothetical protein
METCPGAAANNDDGPQEGPYTVLGGTLLVHHNTEWMQNDNIGYWCSIIIHGKVYGVTTSERNNLGAQIVENYPGHTYNSDQLSKDKFLSDQSNGTKVLDSGGNRYYVAAFGVVDTLTGLKILNIPGVGAELEEGPGVNQSPVAAISASQNPVTLPTNTVTLDGRASSDPDGSIAGYQWSYVSGPGAPPSTSTTASTISYSSLTAGTYRFQLVVTDNQGATGGTFVDVVVKPSSVSGPCNCIIKDYDGHWLFKTTPP